MLRDRFLKKIVMTALCAAVFLPLMLRGLGWLTAHGGLDMTQVEPLSHRYAARKAPVLDARHRRHILYGDAHGGGHLHGVNRACKSEFPADWSARDIIDTVTHAAANDNLDWKTQRNGYAVADTRKRSVIFRIVVDRRRNLVITAYPLNTPRNPRPAPANDNDHDKTGKK